MTIQTCLVSPATDTDLEESFLVEREASAKAPQDFPLGILTLAAVLERSGLSVEIVDLNLWYCEYLRSKERDRGLSFDVYAAGRLAGRNAQLFGLGTICSSYPLTLKISRNLKMLRQDALILLGGPQASAVAVSTLQSFSAVDFILRGEADDSLPDLVRCLGEGRNLESVPGLAFRNHKGIHRNAESLLISDLDRLPLPAFHLYPGMKNSRIIPLEHGRGCPFSCHFCSTNDFFRRRFRLKSPARVIEEMNLMADRYGGDYFDLVHDMFTVDRRRVVEFCEAMLNSGKSYRWGCSARTDCVDNELLELMARAGCVSIFFGVESGSGRVQKAMDKGLDLDEALRNVCAASRNGMATIASLIVGFPDETRNDLEETLSFIATTMRDPKINPQLHLLAPLAGTPLQARHREELFLPEVYPEMSHNRFAQDLDERRLIADHPDVFPNFYAIPALHLERRYLEELREFMARIMTRFRWILVAWHRHRGSVLSLFDEWLSWKEEHLDTNSSPIQIRRYYTSWDFDGHFIAFLVSLPDETRSEFEAVILDYERKLLHSLQSDRNDHACSGPIELIGSDMRLARGKLVFVLRLAGNLRLATDLLSAGMPPQPAVHDPCVVATRLTSEGLVEAIEITSAMARFLELCDGQTTVDGVLTGFAAACGPVGTVSPIDVAIHGLRELYSMKLVLVLPALQRETFAAGVSAP